MSAKYDQYLKEHIENVVKGYDWLSENLPRWVVESGLSREEVLKHDQSKFLPKEYNAYDNHFYGDKSKGEEFEFAWLHHIHNNPHHWQYWILLNDDSEEGNICLDMPLKYIVEMVCDWWSFSWKCGDLEEIQHWYSEHQNHIRLSYYTREVVEVLIKEIVSKLDELYIEELVNTD